MIPEFSVYRFYPREKAWSRTDESIYSPAVVLLLTPVYYKSQQLLPVKESGFPPTASVFKKSY